MAQKNSCYVNKLCFSSIQFFNPWVAQHHKEFSEEPAATRGGENSMAAQQNLSSKGPTPSHSPTERRWDFHADLREGSKKVPLQYVWQLQKKGFIVLLPNYNPHDRWQAIQLY